jgi:hypothetical protein
MQAARDYAWCVRSFQVEAVAFFSRNAEFTSQGERGVTPYETRGKNDRSGHMLLYDGIGFGLNPVTDIDKTVAVANAGSTHGHIKPKQQAPPSLL